MHVPGGRGKAAGIDDGDEGAQQLRIEMNGQDETPIDQRI
jgi:hypothetical protein